MKTYTKHPLLEKIVFVILSLLFLFNLNFSTNKQSSPQLQTVNKTNLGLPVYLAIPTINVNASVEYVGITSEGVMEVPSNIADVGWFKLGSRPGEKGSAVISGHFDGRNGEAGVFVNLYKLKRGDKMYVKDDKGIITTFVVRESRIYNPGYAEEVFSLNDNAHLNLITCDGVWDGVKKSYTKRLVVFADIVK